MKDGLATILHQVTHLFNLSITKAKFPYSWKHATVIPLPTEGDSSDVNHLGPVSLLLLPGKMLERIIHWQVIQYLEENKILDERQGGFRKDHSTISTVASFTDDLFTSVNNKRLT